jgi:glycosyltransferase involved in cell wall biosynthesis
VAPRLTGLVITKNEERRIEACLRALSFCDEIVVIDSSSSDKTPDLVRAAGAQLVDRPFTSFAGLKEEGRVLARGRWVLNVDADELVSAELALQIKDIVARDDEPCAAYAIPFKNYFGSVWVRRAGYYPDPHIRLFLRERARWDPAHPTHARVLVDGKTGMLDGHIEHRSFSSIQDFVKKSSRYAASFAESAHAQGRRAGFFTIASHTFARFFRAFVLQGGFLEGTLGLVIAGLQAYEVFQKYARLWERGRSVAIETRPEELGPPRG